VIDDPALLHSYAERALHATPTPGHRLSDTMLAVTSVG